MAMADDGGRARPSTLVVVAGIVVLVLVAAIVVVVSGSGGTPRDRPAEAEATARSWLRAWTHDDRDAMHRLVVGPAPTLDAVVDGFRSSLQPGAIHASPAITPTIDGDHATVPFHADVELPGFGTWSYRGTIDLIDSKVPKPHSDGTEKKWRVAFSPSTLHPALAEGHSIRFSRTWSPRGALLMTDGSPMPTTMPWRSVAG